MERKQLEKILDGYFIFNKWRIHKEAPKKFMDDLGEFMYIQVIDSFRDFYKSDILGNCEFDLGDLVINPDKVLTGPEEFEKFFFAWKDQLDFDGLILDQIDEPFLLASAKNTDQSRDVCILLSDIKTEADLIEFLNDVLLDIGETTHPSKGNQQIYTVVKIAE